MIYFRLAKENDLTNYVLYICNQLKLYTFQRIRINFCILTKKKITKNHMFSEAHVNMVFYNL